MSFDVLLSTETQFLLFNSGNKKSNEKIGNESNDNYEEEREDGKDIFFKKYFVTNEFYSQMSVKWKIHVESHWTLLNYRVYYFSFV